MIFIFYSLPLIAFVLPIVFILAYDKMKGMPKGEEESEETENSKIAETAEKQSTVIDNTGEKTEVQSMTAGGAAEAVVEKPALHAVVDGKVIPIEQIGDGVFSEKILGDGVGIIPDSEIVVSPADGTVCTIMEDSKHAVGVTLNNGTSILIHVGIDTVGMGGEGFSYFVKIGDKVKTGDKLLSFNKKKIEKKGLNSVVVVVETDSDPSQPTKFVSGSQVKAGKDLIGE